MNELTREQMITMSLREQAEALGISKAAVCLRLQKVEGIFEDRAVYRAKRVMERTVAPPSETGRALSDVSDAVLFDSTAEEVTRLAGVSISTVYRERRLRRERMGQTAKRPRVLENVPDDVLFDNPVSFICAEYKVSAVTAYKERQRRRSTQP